MKYLLCVLSVLLFFSSGIKSQKSEYALVLHGGAGNITPQNMDSLAQEKYLLALDSALCIGEKILKEGGTCAKAVEEVIVYLENNPLFNAGRGAVLAHDGKVELDASVMLGADLNAGAVTGLRNTKNPIRAAFAVMHQSNHVFLSGEAANAFLKDQGIDQVDTGYFYTEKRYKQLQEAISKEKHGTVGCVALDRYGNMAAGTSTGGMTNKKYGRIGDSPIIGAGTYANNSTCGISSTGHGEFFIRYTVAHDISALMEYKGLSIDEAAEQVILVKLKNAGGAGGVVGLDSNGAPAMVFNTAGMFRAYINSEGKKVVAIF